MSKSLEQVIRENAIISGNPVGSHYVLRVLGVEDDHLDVCIYPDGRDGETIDFAIRGNDVMIYEE